MNDIDIILERLNVKRNLKGYFFLKEAIKLSLDQEEIMITKDIYPQIAKNHFTSVKNVERNIRTAVDGCWLRGRKEVLMEIFGGVPLVLLRKPTPYLFIVTICDYLNRQRAAKCEKKVANQ